MDKMQVSERSIDLAIALRKNRSRVAHTLSYARLSPDKPSVIDLVLRYDRYRRTTRSTSRYYWGLLGQSLTPSSASISDRLQACLSHTGVTPLPQLLWSSHSLQMGAASECPAIGVPSYSIRIPGDWSVACTMEESYLDARLQPCEDSVSFFGNLSEILTTPYGARYGVY